jgi:ABC-type sulfate transport system permease subunit
METQQLGGGGEVGIIPGIVGLVVMIVIFAGIWKVFTKAGQPGWAVLIPIYNAYVLCKVAGKSGWWVLLMMIPCVGFIFGILVTVGVAQNFGKGIGFALGLIFLPFIFYPILGFGDASYQVAPA